jgi:hypothetical protein
MTLRRTVAAAVALLFASSTVFAFQTKAPDLTGTWTGTFTSTTSTGEPDEDPAHLELKQKGAELTGTAGPRPDRQMPLAKGTVTTVKDVTTATFTVTEPGGTAIQFELKLVGGRLKGNAQASQPDGGKRTAVVDVGRAK